jgi:tRNA-2-methylthio-N6-dimethylallyladenosine synthase
MGAVPFFHQPDRPAKTRSAPHQAMVRVMFGCDKFCSYCIVPRVRGPEQSRPAAEIYDEVRHLADDGCLEVTLLGQTVNSYQDATGPRTLRLADLLAMLHDIEGLRRLKFVTNYPKHMTDDLLAAMRDLPKVSPYLHVPAQSGSNVILQRMKRGYTAESYREMLQRIRAVLPHAAITSDFIVGFCGETEADFQETVDLVRDARFKNSFIFKYSDRPGTKAAELYADDVPEPVKRRRNNELLALQNAISLEDNQPLLGRTVEILLEGPSKVARHRERADGSPRAAESKVIDGPHPSPLPVGEGTVVQLVGRTTCDRIVMLDGPAGLAGRVVPVVIEKVDAFTLFGRQP